MGLGTTHRTLDELHYIKNIGKHAKTKMNRIQLLESYINNFFKREWTYKIDKKKCYDYAIKTLKEEYEKQNINNSHGNNNVVRGPGILSSVRSNNEG